MPTLEVSLAPDYKGIVKDAVKQKGEAWIKESFPVKAGWWIAKEAVVHGIEKGVEMGVEKLAGVAVGESALPASLTFNAAEIVGDLRVENANLEDEIADFDIKKAGDVKTKIEAAAIGFGVAYEAGLGGKGAQGAPDLYKRGKERRAKLIQETSRSIPRPTTRSAKSASINGWQRIYPRSRRKNITIL